MQMFSPLTSHFCMTTCDHCTSLVPSAGPALLASESSLSDTQAPLGLSGRHEAWNDSPVGEYSESRDTQVDPDCTPDSAKLSGVDFDGETYDPASCVALECATLDFTSGQLAVPVNPQRSRHSLEAKPTVAKRDSLKRPKSEAIEPPHSTKAREARLATGLNSAKEPSVGFIQALEGSSLKTHRQFRRFGVSPSPLSEPPTLLDIADRLAGIAVGANALFEGGVVELALQFQYSLKRPMLSLRGQEPIAKCEDHRAIINYAKLTT
jgi:hypothetical protein